MIVSSSACCEFVLVLSYWGYFFICKMQEDLLFVCTIGYKPLDVKQMYKTVNSFTFYNSSM